LAILGRPPEPSYSMVIDALSTPTPGYAGDDTDYSDRAGNLFAFSIVGDLDAEVQNHPTPGISRSKCLFSIEKINNVAILGRFGLQNEYGVDEEFMAIELKRGVLAAVNGLVKYSPLFNESGC
jgi:hypothetical protein